MLPTNARDIFISYAHADNKSSDPQRRWLDRFIEFLQPLVSQGNFTLCSDQGIEIGDQWHARIQAQLNAAKAVVLLVSPAFLASGYIRNSELQVILKNAADRGVRIFPILISPSLFARAKYKYPDPKSGPNEFTLASLQAANAPSKTLVEMTEGEQHRVLLEVAEQLAELLTGAPPVSPKSALSNLPDRKLFFTGREREFAELQEALVAQGRAALSGLGGVGKTQTVVEYAHRHLEEYAHAFWVVADSREALVSGYVTIASLLKVPAADIQDQMLAVEAVKRWLNSNQDWLLVLDNADDLGMARSFIPSGKNGHVVLTTRAGAVGPMARRLEIQEMGAEEGALLLLRRAKYVAEDAPLEAATEGDQATAKKIATQLDGLPLALDQAGAYVEETSCGLAAYLSLYRHRASELLRRRGMLASDHPESVATTFALVFENIEKANPAAAELLRFCAFLHPDGIPEEVFSENAPELGPVLEPVVSNALGLNNAILEILKYSLLRRDGNAKILEIHRLVQAVLKQSMDEARSGTQRSARGAAQNAL